MSRPSEPSSKPAARPAALAARVAALDAAYGTLDAPDLLRRAVTEWFPDRIALVSSFGAEAAVLLHLAASIDRSLPVIFIDTGRLFPETLQYRDTLAARLGLNDVRTVGPSVDEAEGRDPVGALFAVDPDACCGFRKVEPLAAALKPFAAWISGRKRFQASTRAAMPAFEAEATHIKINPLAAWQPAEIAAYLRAHDLPRHPLVSRGYRSIGCAPCTTAVAADEDPRSGRWRGHAKTECGIHFEPAAINRGGASWRS